MKNKGRILIVDDNISVLNSLELLLKHKFEFIKTTKNPNEIPSLIQSKNFDVVLLDMNFTAGVNTGNEGIFWLKEIQKIDPSIIILLITAYGDIELAVKAIKEGATDFILKPWDNQKLLTSLQAALKLRTSQEQVKKLQNKQKLIKEDLDKHYQMFIGTSKKMKDILAIVQKVAKTDANILILGENGTGKELIAREIHNQSKRKNEVLVSVDMGCISETLFESEMFGHTKGAFTDAKETRIGRFEHASGGTLFLDEIGNLPLTSQSKLLSALDLRKITPVGSNKKIFIDIRLISATNKKPDELVQQGLFREDLLYRLNTVEIKLPPLRERDEDIAILANKFLEIYTNKYEKTGLKINNEAINKLMKYHWPGNIRELKHTMERAVILSESNILTPENIVLNLSKDLISELKQVFTLDEGERILIADALQKNNLNISETAKQLQIGRQTLYRKMERYGL